MECTLQNKPAAVAAVFYTLPKSYLHPNRRSGASNILITLVAGKLAAHV
jgi:hypothetical protein